ncbi:MAG: hypothetical protein ACPGWR_10740 [Ardenticatenaceae bacterium]
MINTMEIDGYLAVVKYDPDIEMFRGEFTFRDGGADFYAKDIDTLRKEGEISLRVFHEMCLEDGIEPEQEYAAGASKFGQILRLRSPQVAKW